jgi:hypothetical protein
MKSYTVWRFELELTPIDAIAINEVATVFDLTL